MKNLVLLIIMLPVILFAQEKNNNGIIMSLSSSYNIEFGYQHYVSENGAFRYSVNYIVNDNEINTKNNYYWKNEFSENNSFTEREYEGNNFNLGLSLLYVQTIYEINNGKLYLGLGPSYTYSKSTYKTTILSHTNSSSSSIGYPNIDKSEGHTLKGFLVLGYEHSVNEKFRIYAESMIFVEKSWMEDDGDWSTNTQISKNDIESTSWNFGSQIGRIGFLLVL